MKHNDTSCVPSSSTTNIIRNSTLHIYHTFLSYILHDLSLYLTLAIIIFNLWSSPLPCLLYVDPGDTAPLAEDMKQKTLQSLEVLIKSEDVLEAGHF